jgi:hypothetical protein
MSKRSTTAMPPSLLEWAQEWAQLDRGTMNGIEQALRAAGLLARYAIEPKMRRGYC